MWYNLRTEKHVKDVKEEKKNMKIVQDITKDIKYVGVDDHEIDLFEGQYVVPRGMAYNSYVSSCSTWSRTIRRASRGSSRQTRRQRSFPPRRRSR